MFYVGVRGAGEAGVLERGLIEGMQLRVPVWVLRVPPVLDEVMCDLLPVFRSLQFVWMGHFVTKVHN